MKKLCFIVIFLVLLCNFCKCQFGESQKNLIKSVIENLSIKHYIWIEDVSSRQVTRSPLIFVKYFSKSMVYGSFLSVEKLIETFQYLYGRPNLKDFSILNLTAGNYRNQLKPYPPKTVILYEQSAYLSEIITSTVLKSYYESALSKYVWLSFDNENGSMLTKLQNSYIPYNCQFLVATRNEGSENVFDIYEIFHTRLYEPILLKSYFGKWKEEKGLEISESDFYQRRFNLNGTVLLFGSNDVRTCHPQICRWLEIIRDISRRMNFQYGILVYDSHFKQTLVPRHLYHYLTLEIYFSRMTINFAYLHDNWIGPIRKRSLYFFVALDKGYEEHNIVRIFLPFSLNLWILIIIWIAMSGTCLVIVTYHRTKNKLLAFESFYQSFEIMVNQGCEGTSSNFHYRIIIFFSLSVASFIIPAYSGAVFSFLLYQNVKLPFTDVKSFVEDGTYKLIKGTKMEHINFDLWLDATNDPYVKMVYSKDLFSRKMLNSLEETTEEMCKDHKLSVITFRDFDGSRITDCEIIKIPTPVFSTWDVFLVRNRSPYKHIFNRIFKTVYSAGWINKHENEHREKNYLATKKAEGVTLLPVQFESLTPAFLVIVIFYVISSLILLGECLFFRRKK